MPDPASSDAPARGRYRFREYRVTTAPDSLALPVFSAACVTGEEHDCGAPPAPSTNRTS
ncbi:hypothetical protein ACIP5L_00170 [Streptomyces bacillaris]|uniref:hypothetical protein n=1 Tax=Streptomyces bacillaris TaxID=68179 RepID=UPI003822C587